MPLSSLTQQELRDGDRFRLVSLKVAVMTDDQIAQAREKVGEELPVRAQIEFELEPLSYRRSDDRNETGFVTVTKGGKNGLTQSEIESIRRDGWLGIPRDKQLSLPRGLTSRDPNKLTLPYQRFMHFATKAGIEILVQGIDPGVPANIPNGQIWSPAIGKVVVCRYGSDEFPMGDDTTYAKWMWYLNALDNDFVALPVGEREVRTVAAREQSTAATTVKAGISGADLRSAVEAVLLGSDADLTSDAQMRLVSRAINEGHYEFAHPDLMEAADQGNLIRILEERGALTVVDGKVA